MAADWTVTDKLACIERELRYRARVYPRRIAEGRMTEGHARREIAVMEAIADDLRQQRDKQDLFAR
jgi:hypothetical protein